MKKTEPTSRVYENMYMVSEKVKRRVCIFKVTNDLFSFTVLLQTKTERKKKIPNLLIKPTAAAEGGARDRAGSKHKLTVSIFTYSLLSQD